MQDTMTASDALALLMQNQQHIHENIKFADQKATAFITINSALLGVIQTFVPLRLDHPVTTAFGALAGLFLALGIAFSVWTIKPRGKQNEERGAGVIDSVRIAQQPLDTYLARIRAISDTDLLDELRTFIYDRAVIDREKYKALALALPLSAVGWALSLVATLLVKMNAPG